MGLEQLGNEGRQWPCRAMVQKGTGGGATQIGQPPQPESLLHRRTMDGGKEKGARRGGGRGKEGGESKVSPSSVRMH